MCAESTCFLVWTGNLRIGEEFLLSVYEMQQTALFDEFSVPVKLTCSSIFDNVNVKRFMLLRFLSFMES